MWQEVAGGSSPMGEPHTGNCLLLWGLGDLSTPGPGLDPPFLPFLARLRRKDHDTMQGVLLQVPQQLWEDSAFITPGPSLTP